MIVGLTGGIGTGKSTVAKLFEVLGCAVFNSDYVAANLYSESEIKARVIGLLGAESYLSDGSINKPFISQRIFSDHHSRLALNAIIHPAVGERFNRFIARNANKIIIKETALLFEAGIENQVNKIVVVTSPEKLRIQRVMNRDGLSENEIVAKMKSQFSESEKISKADYVVYNDEKQFLISQVLKIHNDLLNV